MANGKEDEEDMQENGKTVEVVSECEKEKKKQRGQ
jgi:hypothetical protein